MKTNLSFLPAVGTSFLPDRRGRVLRRLRRPETKKLRSRLGHDSKHQVREHLLGASHPDMSSSKALLEQGVGPLHRRSTLGALRLGRVHGDLLRPPRIGIDQRHNAQILAQSPDGVGVISRINRGVERSHLSDSRLQEIGSRLAVVDRGRGQDGRKRDLSVRHQKIELESLPIFSFALAVPLAAPVTVFGKRPIGGRRSLIAKDLKLHLLLLGPCLSFSGTSPLPSSGRGSGRSRFLHSPLSSLDRRCIQGRINDEGSRIQYLGFQRLMNPPGKIRPGKRMKRPGEGRVRGNSSLKSYNTTENFVRPQQLDQALRGIETQNHLRDKGPGDQGLVDGEPACRGHMLPDNLFRADKLEDHRHLPVMVLHLRKDAFQKRKKTPRNPTPDTADLFYHSSLLG